MVLRLLSVCAVPISVIHGCGSSDDISSVQPMMFTVVDSLLSEERVFAEAGIRLSLPDGFVEASDSIMDRMQEEIAKYTENDNRIEPLGCYLDTQNRAGILIADIDRVNVKSEAEEFVEQYRRSLQESSGGSPVREGSFLVDSVYVRNFLVTHNGMVRFHMLCQADSIGAMELVYFAAKDSYPYLVRHFESSMGTLSRLKQEESQ